MEIYANESAGSDFHLKIAQFVGNRQPLDVKVHIQDHFLQLRQSIQNHESANPWTNNENKIFENILGEYFSKPNSSIASIPWDEFIVHFPSRTIEDIRKHYQKLSYDVTVFIFSFLAFFLLFYFFQFFFSILILSIFKNFPVIIFPFCQFFFPFFFH